MEGATPSSTLREDGRSPSSSLRCLFLLATLVCAGLVLGVFALLFGAMVVSTLPVPVAQVEFDRAAWRAVGPSASGSDRARQRMMDDLLEHRLELGMSKGAVLELLGPPTHD